MNSARVKEQVIGLMAGHAKKDSPIEACGYLASKDGIITAVYPLPNIDKSTDHFSFDPKEQFAVLKDARSKGLTICAVYHSHPVSPARPSIEDIKLAYDPNILYMIVSLAADKPDVKAYEIKEGKVESVKLEVIRDEIL